MRACPQCGLSIGATATFCQVCCTIVDSAPPDAACQEQVRSPEDETAVRLRVAADHASRAQGCEKTDPPMAVALYRQAIVEYLDSSDDPLEMPGVGGHLVFVFDRLSVLLKRLGDHDEALEEIDCAAALGLLDRSDCGAKSRREALTKRGIALRRSDAKTAAAVV